METVYEMMRAVLPFAWARYDFMLNALLAMLLMSPVMGILGTMAVNNKMAFFSDALGHSALTGIALGVALGVDNKMLSMIAFGVFLALVIVRVKAAGSASADTVISVFSSLSTAVGLAVLAANGGFGKYSQYLIGDILSVTPGQILLLAGVLAAVIVIWALIYNKLLLISVNADLAASRGIRTRLVEDIFVVTVAAVVMISIRWIGILLINSMLILPAAAARNISRNSRSYTGLSVLIALVSGVSGLLLSFWWNTSAGASVVLVSAVVFFVTFIFRRR